MSDPTDLLRSLFHPTRDEVQRKLEFVEAQLAAMKNEPHGRIRSTDNLRSMLKQTRKTLLEYLSRSAELPETKA